MASDAVGVTLYYGPGAGAEPTASAVVADLVDVTRMHTADPENHVPHLAFQADAVTAVPWLTIEDTVTSYYFRMRVADQPGIIMLTHDAVERDVNAAVRRIEALPTVLAPVIRIRQEELS